MKYTDCGVSIKDNDALVADTLLNLCKSTYSERVVSGVGGFCGLYEIPNTDLILAVSTDGVGSKLHLANDLSHYRCLSTIGFDLVGMVINDIITCGARPALFLDYIALHSITSMKEKIAEVISGIAAACRLTGTTLIGGETAELPGLMRNVEDYDIAGFGVGIVKKSDLVGSHLVEPGDVVLGIESSGPHSNGYSMIRRIFKECDWTDAQLRESIMSPTILYSRLIDSTLCREVHAMAHVTGGGVVANTERVIPDHLTVEWNLPDLPPIFKVIQERGDVTEDEMRRVFNCGIGFVLIVEEGFAKKRIIDRLNRKGYKTIQIGRVIKK